MNGRICGISINCGNCSINYFLEYCDLTEVIAARLITNFTFVLQRVSKQKFVIIFCSTEVYSEGTLNLTERTFFWNEQFRVLENFLLWIFRKKFSGRQMQKPPIQAMFQEENVCDKISLIFMLWTSYALPVFSSITRPLPLYKRSNIKKDKQNKIMALFVHYHYKREVYCERTV